MLELQGRAAFRSSVSASCWPPAGSGSRDSGAAVTLCPFRRYRAPGCRAQGLLAKLLTYGPAMQRRRPAPAVTTQVRWWYPEPEPSRLVQQGDRYRQVCGLVAVRRIERASATNWTCRRARGRGTAPLAAPLFDRMTEWWYRLAEASSCSPPPRPRPLTRIALKAAARRRGGQRELGLPSPPMRSATC